ncbi:small GTP-binding protein, putative [Trichomonas vaginalis G3]|uniref:Small GTP-binding protein, putative n=1 Tax=Trichomonas vaginalis (strain ATCC PRA-98 / G3) TaxID=412133 RepID=A2DQW8_TRIV3|nr:GTPase protein [Trichomonas vaginalis G3]EAY17235.1 small GTP-binding protein, putative [Trichomonas vaginalis G3]KAI5486233.1 GTPase protein [Trichomonas vaginalis G3]|eukprot:XP_001329458.1 small GTP-binding protein [Trichomonas vaginalis G3]
MLSKQSNQQLRVVTIGDESVGKTSITSYLIDKTFNQYEPSTVGANYQMFTVKQPDDDIVLQIWDTAGQEKFKSLSPIYFRNANAAVVVFSLVNKNSYIKLNNWVTSFREVAGNDALVYVVANKSDLQEEFEVSLLQAEEWATNGGFKFYVTSAKTGQNIEKLFTDIAIDLKTANANANVLRQSRLKSEVNTDSSPCC